MRRVLHGVIGLAVILASASAQAALVSKRYEFKDDVNLEMGASTPGGLRLDGVRFQLPGRSGDRITRTGGLVRARVTVSNTAGKPLKVGLAVALFDDDGRLLAVASGGTNVKAIKPGRQKRFTLVFEGLNAEAHRATTFQISVESKP
jgi:hypothetical protein